MVRVVKNDGASENYVGRMFLDEQECEGAMVSAMDAGWKIVETGNVNAEDGIEKHQ